ncbi:MAG: TonB-dependent receptor [Candidatus Kapaibacterium sp.]|jgi:hypothetical protein|nr:TonB-dependent receptor [Candidatus Kapabacteria bacterium]
MKVLTKYAIITILCLLNVNAIMAKETPPIAAIADAETATLSGYVKDAKSKETLVGAAVTVKGKKIGAYTNKNGFFTLKNIPAGKNTIIVSYVGYRKYEKTIDFAEKESKQLTLELNVLEGETQEVVVEADRAAELREISVSKVNIPVQQLQQLRVGGEADIFRALQFLPGVLTSSQISSGLFIRGGSPDQNLVLLDGSTVYNPSHLFGFISAFNPDAIKDVELIKGGYPAEFGGRLSAVLNLTQKDGNREKVEGVASIGIISSRGSLQGPTPWDGGSFFLGARRTYLDLITSALPEDPQNPIPDFNFYDLNAKISQDLGPNDRLFLAGFYSADNLGLGGAGIEFNLGISNRAGSLRWTHIFSDDLFSTFNLSASRYGNNFDGNNSGFTFEIKNSIVDYTAKYDLEWLATNELTIKGGIEQTWYNFSYFQRFGAEDSIPQQGTNSAGSVNFTVPDFVTSVFAQANYRITDDLSFQAGLRFNYWDSSSVKVFDPRLAMRYQVNEDIAVKGSVGIFHQYLRLASQPDFTFFDTWLPTDRSVPASRADHYILSVETQPYDGYQLNFDTYYKRLYNLSELNQTATSANRVADVFFNGDGWAYGFEVFLQKKIGDFTGWAGYAFGFVEGKFDSVNQGRIFRPKFDRRHDFKVVGLYKLNDHWEFGATFTFQSGQSYTAATSRIGSFQPGDPIPSPYIVPGDRYGLRLPNSHQLNFNVNYLTTLFDLPARLMIDIYNVYSRRDVWFRLYRTNTDVTTVEDIRLLPIIPTVALEVKF